MTLRALPFLLLQLCISVLVNADDQQIPFAQPSSMSFRLRHHHAQSTDSSPSVIFADAAPSLVDKEILTLHSGYIDSYRPASSASHARARRRSMLRMQSEPEPVEWTPFSVRAPNIGSRETLRVLAKMTANAYTEPGQSDWYDLGSRWNNSVEVGWEPDKDGFRGHIFVSDDNSTVVLSVKGTAYGQTRKKDKKNDNMLFSCCCARVGPTWSPVCDCYTGNYSCNQNCLEQALTQESLFYSVGTNLYSNVTYMYPDATIWITGHSLGGSLASLLGATFGAPVVAFEAPGEKLAASRLHLPSPPSTHHITHLYHTADPLAMGTCNGVTSVCAIAGYAMETSCHLGKRILYDTVSDLDWAVDIRTHGIKVVIDRLLHEDWDAEKGIEVPEADDHEADCVDCFSWDFGDYQNSLTPSHDCMALGV